MTQAINFTLIRFLMLLLLLPSISEVKGNNNMFFSSADVLLPNTVGKPNSISITCPENITVNITGSSCEANFNLPSSTIQSVGCTGAPSLVVTSSLNYQNGMVTNAPAGTHLIGLQASNSCGDVATCQYLITLLDAKKPTPVLINTLFANLALNGEVEVKASQLNLNSSDNCTPASMLRFSFSSDVADSIRVYGCDQVGNNFVQIWVFDEVGNKFAMSSKVLIISSQQVCNSLTLTGRIETGDGRDFGGANISVANNDLIASYSSDAFGLFGPVPIDITSGTIIEPSYDSNVLNGVSTFDIWMIQKAVLGQISLTPYQMIAGDVNGSKTITAADASEIRKMILGLQSDFSIGKSWQFVDANFVFPTSGNTLQTVAPENITLAAGITGNIEADFIGLKLGDLNHSCLVGLQSDEVELRQNDNIYLIVQDKHIKKGERVEVPFQISEEGVLGLQFSLEWDTDALEYEYASDSYIAGLIESGVSLQLKNGKLFFNLSWSSLDKSIDASANIITLTFITKTEGLLSDFLRLSEFNLQPEAFQEGETTMHDVKLNYKQPESAQSTFPTLHLDSNIPNPFIEFTSINFSLDKDAHLFIEFFDANGYKIHEQSGLFVAGNNNIVVRRADLKDPGIYTYRISSTDGFVSRKLMMF